MDPNNGQLVPRGWEVAINFDDEEAQMLSQDVVSTAFSVLMSHDNMIDCLKSGQQQLQTATQLLYQMTESQFREVDRQMQENQQTALGAVTQLFQACDTKFMSVENEVRNNFQISTQRQEQLYALLSQAQEEQRKNNQVAQISTNTLTQLGNAINSIVTKLRESHKVASEAASKVEGLQDKLDRYNDKMDAQRDSFKDCISTYNRLAEEYNNAVTHVGKQDKRLDEVAASAEDSVAKQNLKLETFAATAEERQAKLSKKLQSDSERFTKQLDLHTNTIAELEKYIRDLDIASPASVKAMFQAQIAIEREQVTKLEKDIQVIREKQISRASVQRQVQTVDERVSVVEQDLDGIKNTIVELTKREKEDRNNIATLTSSVNSAHHKLQLIKEDIQTLNKTMVENMSALSSSAARASSPVAHNPYNDSTEISSLRNTVQSQAKDISNLKQDMELLKQQLSEMVSLRDEVSRLKSQEQTSTADRNYVTTSTSGYSIHDRKAQFELAQSIDWVDTANTELANALFGTKALSYAAFKPYAYPFFMSKLMSPMIASVYEIAVTLKDDTKLKETKEKIFSKMRTQTAKPSSAFLSLMGSDSAQDIAEITYCLFHAHSSSSKSHCQLLRRARLSTDKVPQATEASFKNQASGKYEVKDNEYNVDYRLEAPLNFL